MKLWTDRNRRLNRRVVQDSTDWLMGFAGCVSVRRRTLTALLCSFCFRGRGGCSPLKQKEKDERSRVAHADTDGGADRATERRLNSPIQAAAIGSCRAKQNMTPSDRK